MASKALDSLKREIKDVLYGRRTEVLLNPIHEKCTRYIEGVILDGINSPNELFSSYCSYVGTLEKRYLIEDFIARVVFEDHKIYLDLNPIALVDTSESEDQIIFVLAHEVKHLLFRHIIKYKFLYREDVTALFLNLATDVEVNESLKKEFFSNHDIIIKRGMSSAIPKNLFDMQSMAYILEVDEAILRHDCDYAAKKYTTADLLYKKLNRKCIKVLGYSINEILYNCVLEGKDFVNEVFAVVDGVPTTVFNISDMDSAVAFCKKLIQYLKRKVYVPLMIFTGDNNEGGGASADGLEGSGDGDGNGSGDGDSEGGSGKGDGSGNGNVNGEGEGSGDGSGSGSGLASGCSGVSACKCNMADNEINDLIEEMQKGGDTVVENISPQKSRSAFGHGGLGELSYKPVRSVVPWQNVLERLVTVMSEKHEETRRRLNRRQPDRLELSGRKRTYELQLVVGRDNSGSISDKEFNYFSTELLKIAKKFECELHLYEFTSKIERYTAFKSNTLKRQTVKSLGCSSRFQGGTCFQPVFDAVDSNVKIRKRECLVVMFTDGDGEPHVDYKGVKNRFWVVTSGELTCDEAKSNVFKLVDLGLKVSEL